MDKTKSKGIDGEEDEEDEEQMPGPLLVSFTTACGVTFVLCLIWIASRWKITCLRTAAAGHGRQQQQSLSPVCHPGQQSSSSSSAASTTAAFFASETIAPGRRRQQQRSLWTWISPQSDRGAVHQLDDDSLPPYDRQLDLGQQSELDRVALIAYMNDSNNSSQVRKEKQFRIHLVAVSCLNGRASCSHYTPTLRLLVVVEACVHRAGIFLGASDRKTSRPGPSIPRRADD